jgi:hypothetical protein
MDRLVLRSGQDLTIAPRRTFMRIVPSSAMVVSLGGSLSSVTSAPHRPPLRPTEPCPLCRPLDPIRLLTNDKSPVAGAALGLRLRELRLTFIVSSDEEYVRIEARGASSVLDLGARKHNYLLLTLARRRLDDAAQDQPDTTCGWIYQDEIDHDPSMAPSRLNIDVFRIRRHFARHGVVDAHAIVERRPPTRQLRIGAAQLAIVRA